MALPVNGSTYLIPALLLIYRPRKDERLSWPSWLTCSGWFTHISGHQSAAGRAQDRESSPATERELYATLLMPNFRVHRHIKPIPVVTCISSTRWPARPHPSARRIRIVSTQGTMALCETSHPLACRELINRLRLISAAAARLIRPSVPD